MANKETKQPSSVVKEIQVMMFGLGDFPAPLLETAELIHDIVFSQISTLIYKANEVSERAQSKVITIQDLLYVISSDRVMVQRVLKYLQYRDSHSKLLNAMGIGVNSSGVIEEDATSLLSSQNSRLKTSMCYLRELGLDLDDEVTDTERMRRDYRAYWIAANSPNDISEKFTKARQTSFMSAVKDKRFHRIAADRIAADVVTKVRQSTYDVIAFIAREMVALLVDCAFQVRSHRCTEQGKPFSKTLMGGAMDDVRAHLFGTPFSTSGQKSITPDEILEVIRRYGDKSKSPFSYFDRSFSPNFHTKIIT